MRRRSRLLRVAKWGGVLMCVLLVGGYVRSGWYGWYWNGRHLRIEIGYGTISLEHHTNPLPYPYARPSHYARTQPWESWNARWVWVPSVSRRDFGIWMNGRVLSRPYTELSIPLWVPFAVTASLTVFLWLRDRRPLPGHCPCGYDLRGNVSGVCPECGREVSGCG